jgi:hypothetical protein
MNSACCGRKSPKADNLLKTKGNFSAFSLPKAENILKINHLPEAQNWGFGHDKPLPHRRCSW